MKSISEQALFYLTLIGLTTAIPSVKSKDEILGWIHNITSQLCPYTDFCHTKASKVFNYAVQDQAPCCSDCSCDDDCIETNSCCPDKAMVSHNSTGLVCKNTMTKKRSKNRDTRNNDGLSNGIKRYFITDSCPAGETDKDIQHRCLGTNKTTLDDFVWVLDTATGKIYQNYHCAKCHGIESWETFNIRTQCSNNIDNNFDNLTTTLLSEDCNIINEISDKHAATTEKYRCYTPTISVCNQTGQWRHYDADIDEACQRNMVPFFQADVFKTVIYKNHFCYVCNTEKMSGAELVCPAMNVAERFDGATFDALINYMGKSRKENDRADSVCAVDQIYDKYKIKETFPSRLKMAQVTPVYKKDDPFIQKNYRPVSILPTMSKLYERLLSDQLSAHFNSIFHNFLAAFRASYGCLTTLLRIVEDWKAALDENMYIGAVLMDLSKAFDCLPHDLLLAKLKAYGVNEESCNLMGSYLSNRHQRGICRKLLCPFGSEPVSGQCKSLTVNISNLGIYLFLKLRIDWDLTKLPDLNQSSTFSKTDGEDIAKSVTKALKVKACTVCELGMTLIDSTSRQPLPDMEYWLTVSTNADCQYEWLHENIDIAMERRIKVSLNRGPIFFQLQYEIRLQSEVSVAHDFLYMLRLKFCKWSVIPKVKFCPGIRLLNSEIDSLKHQRAKRLLVPSFDAANANDTDTAFICLADYFRIMEQTNTAQRMQAVWLVLVLILLQICACC